ncbi:hypothetical protein [Phyllobacterium lublinensis]|uniref:hypothetical protein n=1 Tax=Phyllobacterium lublinensis TaxID=2875708 RepID=UPI001CC94174|nr:hypothetical protein [Phyllobacterium sp. 2063]MBZ9654674.1 hypothetical protein [Phyllobacterium sp. 2063]
MALPLPAVFNGPGGTLLTEEELKTARALELRKQLQGIDTSPVGHWSQGAARVADAIAGAFRRGQLDKQAAANDTYNDDLLSTLTGPSPAIGGDDGRYTVSDTTTPTASSGPRGSSTNPSDEGVYTAFIDTVKNSGLTNPYGLAAVASTGKHESGYSARNAYGNWADPSESGRQLTAGGVMSWNGPRYEAMKKFVADNGGDPNRPDPTLQAKFFINEDPSLIAKLQAAKSVEEAQTIMNNAWRFAGYNRPGGEASRRIDTARMYVPKFAGSSASVPAAGGVQVASIDPSAGMDQLPDIAPQPDARPVADVNGVSVGTGGTPVLDVTDQPTLSSAAGVPFVAPNGQPNPVVSAIRPSTVPASVARVAQALPIRTMADPNDQIVAGMAETVQPTATELQGVFPPAPSVDGVPTPPQDSTSAISSPASGPHPASPENAPASQNRANNGPSLADLVRIASDPRANDRTKAVASAIYQQRVAELKAQQEQEQWLERQAYERAQKEADPKYRQDLEKGNLEIEKLKAPPTTSDITEYEYARGQGETRPFNDWLIEKRKAGAANNSVTIEGEKKQDQTIGEGLGKDLLTFMGEEKTARSTISSLNAMEKEMEDPNFYSGSGAQTVANLKRFAVTLGINPDSVASTEAFNALSKKAVLDNMGGSLGTGVSNADRDYIEGQVPTISNTKEGNRKIIDITRRINQRKIKVAELARAYAKAHDNRLDLNFYDELGAWADKNPLFSEEERKGTTAPSDATGGNSDGWMDVPGGGRVKGAF